MARKNFFSASWLLPLIPVAAGLFLLVGDPLPLRSLRNNLFDQYQRWQPRAYDEAPVRIIDIDDESLARLGQWPWPRTRLAELVDRLSAGGAAAIAFDVIFAEPDRTSPQAAAGLWALPAPLRRGSRALPDHDAVLRRALRRGRQRRRRLRARARQNRPPTREPRPPGRRLARPASSSPASRRGAGCTTFSGAVPSLPALEAAAKGNGALTFVPDGDGVVRRVPLVLRLPASRCRRWSARPCASARERPTSS